MTKEQKMSHVVNQRVSAPFTKRDLEAFLTEIPDEAELKVVTFTSGQRDPVDTAYNFNAQW